MLAEYMLNFLFLKYQKQDCRLKDHFLGKKCSLLQSLCTLVQSSLDDVTLLKQQEN